MAWHYNVLIGTYTLFSMMFLGLSLFRIAMKLKWAQVLLISLFVSSLFSMITLLFKTEHWNTLLIILTEAGLIHYQFRLRKLHSLLIVFLGSLGYTIYLAVVVLFAWSITRVPVDIYFEGIDTTYCYFKLAAATLACLTAGLLIKRRLGFTVRLEYFSKFTRPQNPMLFHVVLFTFILFSTAYYTIKLKFTTIFYFAACFCILLGWILYLLYRKEMEDI
ncbi:hypothetical protein BC351_05190 [Paenibacillus ferrarius]|uniref:Uncharacterized protein n=1 Tax=Paenibacillus ferrarius TaxID=1469647 RepID=A0A1V4HEV4_9BACL|nr:hypothetical protein [Paenibacillus ferrarius]OPH53274.1 hypothetical protein BC351_05190 [Paenibacillus ferrarius]